ncbi:uncharacterized protein LOC130670580 [Microplitis mediator]|uniref:uncharacterized protein LOC130670580 n=1 Tax=Microplitis mediator TaxID=375433 RepID=UPI00255785A2|nr:uncharacterized protein LOC130670580 [Microplitis mediator]
MTTPMYKCSVLIFHAPRFTAQELRRQQMILELKRRAMRSNAPPNEIFNAVSREFDDIADIFNPAAGRMMIIRERRLHRPPMPATVNHVGPMLDRYLPAVEIYRGEVQGTDGSLAFIFGSQQMMERLNNVAELFIDGTFRVNYSSILFI